MSRYQVTPIEHQIEVALDRAPLHSEKLTPVSDTIRFLPFSLAAGLSQGEKRQDAHLTFNHRTIRKHHIFPRSGPADSRARDEHPMVARRELTTRDNAGSRGWPSLTGNDRGSLARECVTCDDRLTAARGY